MLKNIENWENNLITIQNVTARQQKILDHMWELGDVDALESWKNTLAPKLKQEAELLEELIMLAVYDSIIDETEDDFMEANEIIARCCQ